MMDMCCKGKDEQIRRLDNERYMWMKSSNAMECLVRQNDDVIVMLDHENEKLKQKLDIYIYENSILGKIVKWLNS